MQYSYFKGCKISKLGFGTLRLPIKENGDLNFDLIEKMVDYSIVNGINYFDTAYSYGGGLAEVALGKALKKYNRNSYYLIDKMPTWRCKTKEDVDKIFNEQLSKCEAEYFDFYLIHSVKDHRYSDIENLDLINYLEKKKREGKVKYLGASLHCSIETCKLLLENYGEHLDFIQLQLNYMDWKNFKADKMYEIVSSYNKPITVMEPLRGGMLAFPPSENVRKILDGVNSKCSYPSLGLRFVRDLPNVLVTLSGMSNMEQLKENIKIFDEGKLTEDELNTINKAAKKLSEDILVPCTACDYCSECPQNIQISSIFKIYNEAAAHNFNRPWASLSKEYKKFEKNTHDCIGCRKCEKHCPQDIHIVEQLKVIDKKYVELDKEGK